MNYTIPIFDFWIGFILLAAFSATIAVIIDRRVNRERRTIEECDKELRLLAVWCARKVQNLMRDERSVAALDAAERFANGGASQKELTAARADAGAALIASRAEQEAELRRILS